MTTPQGPYGDPDDHPQEPPAWGRQPAGGWGGPDPRAERAPGPRPERAAPPPRERQAPPAAAPWTDDPQQPAPWQDPAYRAGSDRPAPWQDPSYRAGPEQPPPWQDAAEPPHWAGQQTWGVPAGPPPAAAPGPGPGEPVWDYPALPEPVPRERRRGPVVAGGVALVLLALVGLLGFVTPGFLVTRVFEAGALETGVAQVLTGSYGYGEVRDVRCGDAVEVVEGARFACDATVDGAPVSVPVTVTSGDGEYEVGRPL